MIDVLYIYKHSPNNGEELRYSLRSLEKNVLDVHRVVISGDCPDFINKEKVIYIETEDIGAPMTNHWWKVLNAFERTNSDRFALMYDDIFFVKPTNLSNYPFYQKGALCDNKDGGEHYRQTLKNAELLLKRFFVSTYNHELHVPCIYEKEKFKELDFWFFCMKDDCQSAAVRSIYGNKFCSNQPYRGDIKVKDKETKIEDIVGIADCFSCSDEVFTGNTLEFLKKEFPNKSKLEL